MLQALTIAALVVTFLMGTAFVLGRHLRRRAERDELSPVTKQHIELFQGAQLSESAIESSKLRLRTLLERGDVDAVEASLRPGTSFVVQVRALAEIGTDDAGRILERQLQRRLTDDQLEQSWYWIDLANGLRSLNREQSLPHLLRCAESAGDIPLGHFLAAETVCFLGFSGYLRQPTSPLGRAALRVLHRVLEGLRFGVQPHVVIEARLGEAVENLWDNLPEKVQPLVVRIFLEAARLLRRAPHVEIALVDEGAENEAFQWQISRIAALESALQEYVDEAARPLAEDLSIAPVAEQRDILYALSDLRADAAEEILPLLRDPHFQHVELAIETLNWSRDQRVGRILRDWTVQYVPILKRAQKRRKARAAPRHTQPRFPYQAVLRALRGHPMRETELFLLLAARDWDPTFRAAAIGSLGWWEPILGKEVYMSLEQARLDPNAEVRQAARCALGRLGERQSLDWFRHSLCSEDPLRVHEAVQIVANEGLTLLWPDLDRLADSEDLDVAYHAREALERMQEDLNHRLRQK
ncbi:MAG: HEAT repeat domain-containing protein [Gemmataceae bacterium]